MVDIDMTLTAPGCPVAGEMPVDNELEASDAVEAMEVCAHPYVCVFTIRLRLCIP